MLEMTVSCVAQFCSSLLFIEYALQSLYELWAPAGRVLFLSVECSTTYVQRWCLIYPVPAVCSSLQSFSSQAAAEVLIEGKKLSRYAMIVRNVPPLVLTFVQKTNELDRTGKQELS